MLFTTHGGGSFRSWDGPIFESDIVRAAIRPKVKAIGKLSAMHIRETAEGLQVNPEPYMRVLLEDPNPYSSGQMFLEQMATLLALNNNAFARILRDENGFPVQLYPLQARSAEAMVGEDGRLAIKFQMAGGQILTLPYSDVIHLRDDYNDNSLFGSPKAQALKSLLEIINASDQAIVSAVNRSSVIRWLMKFKVQLNPEDRKRQVKEFSEQFLSLENETGVAASDPSRYDLEQVKENNQYVPQSAHQQRAIERIYAFFGVNEKIVQAKYNEDEWIAYYEAEIEPLAKQLSQEFTRKLFSRRERGFGNRIVFGAADLSYASMRTKLELRQMVDRGAMVPNEWRRILNLPPIPGGDKPIRRLDTAEVVEESENTIDKADGNSQKARRKEVRR